MCSNAAMAHVLPRRPALGECLSNDASLLVLCAVVDHDTDILPGSFEWLPGLEGCQDDVRQALWRFMQARVWGGGARGCMAGGGGRGGGGGARAVGRFGLTRGAGLAHAALQPLYCSRLSPCAHPACLPTAPSPGQ